MILPPFKASLVRAWVLVLVALSAGPLAFAETEPAPSEDGRASDVMQVMRTPDGVKFGLFGSRPSTPAPTLFVFAQSVDLMGERPAFTEIGRYLAAEGFLYVTVDPPGHGEDERPGEPKQLSSWWYRIENNSPLFEEFTDRATKVLDHLIAEGYADPQRVAAAGNSRGGFLAFQFAAADTRVRAAVGISPVTDLLALSEFRKIKNPEAATALSLERIIPKLVGKPVFITIGNRDERVNTDAAIAFARKLVAANLEGVTDPKAIVPVHLIVGPSPGHGAPARSHAIAAEWLLAQFKASPAASH